MWPCRKETLSNLVLVFHLLWNKAKVWTLLSQWDALQLDCETERKNGGTWKLKNCSMRWIKKTALCVPHLTWQMGHFYVYLTPIERFWKRGLWWTTTALKISRQAFCLSNSEQTNSTFCYPQLVTARFLSSLLLVTLPEDGGTEAQGPVTGGSAVGAAMATSWEGAQ